MTQDGMMLNVNCAECRVFLYNAAYRLVFYKAYASLFQKKNNSERHQWLVSKLFWHKFTYSFCKLDILISIQQILCMLIKKA
jgi:hypothetical protein